MYMLVADHLQHVLAPSKRCVVLFFGLFGVVWFVSWVRKESLCGFYWGCVGLIMAVWLSLWVLAGGLFYF